MKRKASIEAENVSAPSSIKFGKRYPITINASSLEQSILTLQYGFKPANIDNSQPGRLEISSITAQHTESNVRLSMKTEEGRDLLFRGSTLPTLSSSGGQNEYVLRFDENTQAFTLLRVDKCIVNLRTQVLSTVDVDTRLDPNLALKKSLNKLIKGTKKKVISTKASEEEKEDKEGYGVEMSRKCDDITMEGNAAISITVANTPAPSKEDAVPVLSTTSYSS
jgi:hypothetical protein